MSHYPPSEKLDAAVSWGTSGGLSTAAISMPPGWPQFILFGLAVVIGVFRGLYEYEKWKLIRKQRKLPRDDY